MPPPAKPAKLLPASAVALAATIIAVSLHSASASPFNAMATLADKKIIGGMSASIQQYPFVADILIVKGKKVEQQCGATVLDEYHLLSAAHCFEKKNWKMYRVRVGTTTRNKGGQVVEVADVQIHPRYYKKAPYDYDVSVITVAQPLKIDNITVKKITLVKPKTVFEAGTEVTLLGWGYTDKFKTKIPFDLHKVNVETIDLSECQSDYSSFELEVTERMFCAMSMNKDSCQGDSGSGVINAKTNEQMGIVSWSMGCAQMGSPSVFTNLADADIQKFIAEKMKIRGGHSSQQHHSAARKVAPKPQTRTAKAG